jgi:molybdenum cofactor synthesis domain-containing protein
VLIPLDEARSYVLERCVPLPATHHALADARGLVVAETVSAGDAVPPFDNTAMDGFAVRAADTFGAPRSLRLVGTLAAGRAWEEPLQAGEALRIMTGAPMPPGADAVVMVERTTVSDDDAEVVVEVEVESGNHVRRAGEDLAVGDVAVEVGSELTPGRLGLLATVGRDRVTAVPRARVGVFSTGDELVDAGVPLEPGQIRDSNRVALVALVAEMGAEPVDLGRLPDDEAAIEAGISTGAGSCDALLSTGGVSMGDFDYVKVVLDRIGDIRWMQIAIKPAKPLAFGTVGSVPVFGLPGNPLSSMVSFELFARPALLRMMGHTQVERTSITSTCGEPLRRRPDGKTHFVRVVHRPGSDGGVVSSAGGQGSHQLSAMAAANALAIVPDGDGPVAGDRVEVMLL